MRQMIAASIAILLLAATLLAACPECRVRALEPGSSCPVHSSPESSIQRACDCPDHALPQAEAANSQAGFDWPPILFIPIHLVRTIISLTLGPNAAIVHPPSQSMLSVFLI